MRTRTTLTLSSIALCLLVALLMGVGSPEPRSFTKAPEAQPLETSVIFVIRHAETDPKGGNNPDLTPEGLARAVRLSGMLQDESIGAIFVTNTARSIQTATPISTATGIAPTVYPPLDADGLVQTIRSLPQTDAVLVVAHSNTAPLIVAALGGPSMDELGHDEFDRFFAVVLSNGRHVRTVRLHY